MSKPKSSLLAVERLRKLRESLNQNKFVWAASCLGKYLDDEVKSLDEAFGVKQPTKRGAPGDPARREEIARKIFAMRHHQKKTWEEVEAAFDADPRRLRRIYNEFFVKLAAEKISRDTD